LDRIVAEQREMSGPAAWRDAGRHRQDAAERGARRDPVEVRRAGAFERSRAVNGMRQVAETVEHQQDDLRFIRENQRFEGFEGQERDSDGKGFETERGGATPRTLA